MIPNLNTQSPAMGAMFAVLALKYVHAIRYSLVPYTFIARPYNPTLVVGGSRLPDRRLRPRNRKGTTHVERD